MFSIRILQALLLTLSLGTLVSACARETPAAPAKPASSDPAVQLDTIVLGMGLHQRQRAEVRSRRGAVRGMR
ncbi:MAG: hypothetical protein LT080_03120 [Thiobacillus sp.]|nr:hypothetical protein [Thiobacillus sp.]